MEAGTSTRNLTADPRSSFSGSALPAIAWIRRSLLTLLLFGVAGVGAELFLLEHYEDWRQVFPLALIGCFPVVFIWHVLHRGRSSIRALRVTMILFVISGPIGGFFHYRGARSGRRLAGTGGEVDGSHGP